MWSGHALDPNGREKAVSLCTFFMFVYVCCVCVYVCIQELSCFKKHCKHPCLSAALQLVVMDPALFTPCRWQAGHREGRGVTDSHTNSQCEGLLTATWLLQKKHNYKNSFWTTANDPSQCRPAWLNDYRMQIMWHFRQVSRFTKFWAVRKHWRESTVSKICPDRHVTINKLMKQTTCNTLLYFYFL